MQQNIFWGIRNIHILMTVTWLLLTLVWWCLPTPDLLQYHQIFPITLSDNYDSQTVTIPLIQHFFKKYSFLTLITSYHHLNNDPEMMLSLDLILQNIFSIDNSDQAGWVVIFVQLRFDWKYQEQIIKVFEGIAPK